MFAYRKPERKALVCRFGNDRHGAGAQTANMAKRSRRPVTHHLRAWRIRAKLTQEELADILDTDKSVISLLETGGMGMTTEWADRLAPPLGTTPGLLIDHDPSDIPPDDLVKLWKDLHPDQRQQAGAILETFRKPK